MNSSKKLANLLFIFNNAHNLLTYILFPGLVRRGRQCGMNAGRIIYSKAEILSMPNHLRIDSGKSARVEFF